MPRVSVNGAPKFWRRIRIRRPQKSAQSTISMFPKFMRTFPTLTLSSKRNRMETLPSPYDQLFSSYAYILGKNGAQSHQEWCHLNFEGGFKFGDRGNSDNCCFLQIERVSWTKKQLHFKGHFSQFRVSKIFERVPYPNGKFNEKHDGVAAKPVRLTVLELCSNFMPRSNKNWAT